MSTSNEKPSPLKKWAEAGSKAKDLAGEFSGHLKAEKGHLPSAAEAKKIGNQLIDARSAQDLKEAVSTAAQRTGESIREVSETVQRAASNTKQGEKVDDLRDALSDAFTATVGPLQEKIAERRERRAQQNVKDTGEPEKKDTEPGILEGEVIAEREEDR